ncbi:MAG: NUDIX domain-containing protein [Chloroflexota bacterium]
MSAGKEYIGVGVGALVFNAEGQVFLAKRGPAAKNEAGCWEFPGGGVDFGETMVDAIIREFMEEYGMEIAVTGLLGVVDHILPDEGQHWISPTYLATHVSGTPKVLEPRKCTAIGWFSMHELPQPLSVVSQEDVKCYFQLNPDG